MMLFSFLRSRIDEITKEENDGEMKGSSNRTMKPDWATECAPHQKSIPLPLSTNSATASSVRVYKCVLVRGRL